MDSLRKYLHLQLLIECSPPPATQHSQREARRHNNKQRTRYGQMSCRTEGRTELELELACTVTGNEMPIDGGSAAH